MNKYEVIIAGAGFTGLTLASRLKANVLLIDKFDIGTHNISACGTMVKTMRKINCEDSIVQEFNKLVIHVDHHKIQVSLPEPFCTIDFEHFCELLNQQNQATFVKASVKSVEGDTVFTDCGEFSANVIVDATGWEAVLASSANKDYVNKDKVAFGIETEIDYVDDRLHFFLDQNRIENGAAWLFPAGEKSRFGLVYYAHRNKCNLIKKLGEFVEGEFGLTVKDIHGGGFGYDWKQKLVVNDMFVVGSSAGQTLPMSGEGIRRSIDFGIYCGDLIQAVIEGKLTKAEAFKKYEAFALQYQDRLSFLLRFQNKLHCAAKWKVHLAMRVIGFFPLTKYFWRWYAKI